MRKIFVTLAATALVMAGCSKNEVTDLNNQTPDAIKFTSTTSRASINDLAALQLSATGFRVYAMGAANAAAWYTGVDGSDHYKYTTPNWGWTTGSPQWPIATAGYPMKFYAMYPAADAPTTATPGATPTINKTVTIAATAATQVDMLAATATTAMKPADGYLPLNFTHILSKVNFGVIAGNGATVELQSTAVKNNKNTGSYNYVSKAWASVAGTANYDYFNNPAAPFSVTGAAAAEDVAAPIYTGDDAKAAHLMLMPQTTTAWDLASPITGSYMEVVYRITRGADNYIGFDDANDYQTLYPTFVSGGWGGYTGIGTGGTLYDGALYIKVGFPAALAWEQGKGYTYNFCLGTAGSTNGYYTDDTYYDEDGNKTDIPIIGPKGEQVEPGEPVTDGTINFKVSVTEWDDTTPATPLQ